ALAPPFGWPGRRANDVARANGLTRYHDSGSYQLSLAPVPETLVAEDPTEAVRQCTLHLETAKGSARGALLILRAAAHDGLGNASDAIQDYQEALAIPGYPKEVLHKRLTWLHWGEGRLIEAARHAELGLREKPDAE